MASVIEASPEERNALWQVYYNPHQSFSFVFKEIRGLPDLTNPPIWANTIFNEETKEKHISDFWEKSWNFDQSFSWATLSEKGRKVSHETHSFTVMQNLKPQLRRGSTCYVVNV